MSLRSPLEPLSRFAVARPWTALLLAAGISALLGSFAIGLRLDPDPVNMLPRDSGPLQRLNELVEVFGSGDRLFLAVEGSGTDAAVAHARTAVDHLAERILDWEWRNPASDERETMVGMLLGRQDPALFEATKDLVGRAGFLALPDDPTVLERFADRLHPKLLAYRFRSGPPPGVPAPLHDRDLLGLWTDFYRPYLDVLDEEDLPLRSDQGYLSSQDRTLHVLLLNPELPIKNMPFTHAIAERLAGLAEDFRSDERWQGLELHVAGGYLLADEDFSAAQDSALLTLITSLTGITLLFGLVYRSLRLIAFIAAVILPAAAAALGMATLWFGGSLSLLVSAFSAVLVGLGVDYIIHVYNAYSWSLQHERTSTTSTAPPPASRGMHPDPRRAQRAAAAAQAVHRVGQGILIGCVTSVAPFSILALSDFRGLQELGLVTAFGLAFILVMVALVIPALLTLAGPMRCREPRLLHHYGHAFARRPGRFALLATGLMVSVVAVLGSADTWFVFDSDLRNLRPRDSTGS
ncbi:MAG: MMPL family transporter, partial [Planctomycetota bacterium]